MRLTTMDYNTQSPGFSQFRQLMDLWDNHVFKESVQDEIDKFLTHKELVMFFLYPAKDRKNKKTVKLYGTTEDGRLAFAKMKSPNPDDPIKAEDSFQAFDLQTLIDQSDEPEDLQRIKIFNRKDLNKIKIVPQEYAVKKLSSKRLGKKLKPVDTPEDKEANLDDE